jgi:hypothetical protein
MSVLLELVGLITIAVGVALFCVPAGVIVAGIFAVMLGISLDGVTVFPSRQKAAEQPEDDL